MKYDTQDLYSQGIVTVTTYLRSRQHHVGIEPHLGLSARARARIVQEAMVFVPVVQTSSAPRGRPSCHREIDRWRAERVGAPGPC